MSAIKEGDLVMVVRSCCVGCAERVVGKIGKVKRFHYIRNWHCPRCGASGNDDPRAIAFDGEFSCAPISWLKKIDPPAEGELDGVPVREKVTA